MVVSCSVITHPRCLDHDMGPLHPESPARLQAVLDGLRQAGFTALRWVEAPKATRDQLLLVHRPQQIDQLFSHAPQQGLVQLDGDTALCPASVDAALFAAGAGIRAVDLVVRADAPMRIFCAVRPPGHHAEPQQAMGFCLFNNAAIAARYAQEVHGFARVAVVDFDVHHGNGTQAAFEQDPSLFYASLHQAPLYPGTGASSERGIAKNIVNLPLPPFADGQVLRTAFMQGVEPALAHFAPDLLLVSAGFDGHKDDPLAQWQLTEEDYAWMTARLVGLAKRYCKGHLISFLEGGYDLAALQRSALAHVTELMQS